MAYTAPFIDTKGIHVPTYEDIREDLISSMRTIFGSEIYLDEDSQDYQQISIFAKKIFDTNSLAVLVYNNRTANTAVGIGLDNLCALVGIKRKPATYSTVQVDVTGDPGTVINSGEVSDGINIWTLPDVVTIPENGIITVECKSKTPGYFTALPNTINTIVTPVFGWISVTNTYTSSPGTDEETDASLRGRYERATLSPSVSIFDGIIAAVEQVEGVGRVKAYENDTGSTSSEGFHAHSITFVVEGGDDNAIATELFYKKTPGCYTNGDVEVELLSVYGNTTIIRFYRPSYKQVWIKVSLKKLTGYNDSYEDDIKNAIVDYISSLQIAETVYRSIIWSVATSQMSSLKTPEYSVTDIQMSTDGSSYNSNDISMTFKEVASIDLSKITVEVT